MISCRYAIAVVAFSFSIAGVWSSPVRSRNDSTMTESTSRVVNGLPVTDANEYPFVVDLSAHATTISSSRFCTGTLVRPDVVLTAAHCVLNDGYSHPVYATVGRIELHDKHTANGKARTFRTIASIVHPEYQGLGSAKDIAVMLLNESSKALTVSLAEESPKENDETWVVGYGVQRLGTLEETGQPVNILSARLQKSALRIKKKEFCDVPGADFRTQDGMLCTAGVKEGSSACKGDSGGGLFLRKGKKIDGAQTAADKLTTQVGVVSYGDSQCMSEDSGVFTDVASVKHWIDLAASRLQSVFHGTPIKLDSKASKMTIHLRNSTPDPTFPVLMRTAARNTNDSRTSMFYTIQADFPTTRTITAKICDSSKKSDSFLFLTSTTHNKFPTETPADGSDGSCARGRLSKLSFEAKKGNYVIGVSSNENAPPHLSVSSENK